MDTFNNDFSIDDGLKTEGHDDDQDMSRKISSVSGDKMLDELQNPMSVAPPSVAPSTNTDFDDPPESPMSHFSHPPSPPGGDSPPPSPLSHPPRPDTASSINQPPTPIAFGEIQQPMTPLSQRSITPQPRPEQPPTPISQYQEPPSPMAPAIQHMPIKAPMSTNQVMNSMHQSVQNQTHHPNPSPQNTQRMNLRERKEQPITHYQSMDQNESVSNNRRRRVRRQLIIDQVNQNLNICRIYFLSQTGKMTSCIEDTT